MKTKQKKLKFHELIKRKEIIMLNTRFYRMCEVEVFLGKEEIVCSVDGIWKMKC
jgi:hypothetical protein